MYQKDAVELKICFILVKAPLNLFPGQSRGFFIFLRSYLTLVAGTAVPHFIKRLLSGNSAAFLPGRL